MQMSVTPKEIAQHLIEEHGHEKAVETFDYHLNRCRDDETKTIWSNIGHEIHSLKNT